MITTTCAHETEQLAERLATLWQAGDLVLLEGGVGAGKTTFARGAARGLGVSDIVVSPTFTIVREYEGRVRLAHVDVYRLERTGDLVNIGFDELVDSDCVVLVEWGNVVAAALPEERLEISIQLPTNSIEGSISGDDERMISIVARGPSWIARREQIVAALISDVSPGVLGEI